MGEQRRRAQRRQEAREAGRPFEPEPYRPSVQKFRQRVLDLPIAVDDEVRIEWEKYIERTPGRPVRFLDYIVALLEASVERERQAREALEAVEVGFEVKEKKLVLAATPEQVAKVLAPAGGYVGQRTA